MFKKLIEKNIIKILTIYNKGKEKVLFSENKNYLDDKIYFDTLHLIRLIKEREEEHARRNSRI